MNRWRNWIKRGGAVLLAAAMAVTLLPGVTGEMRTVRAEENTAPGTAYWTNVDGLKSFSLSSASTAIGKIRFGAGNRTWAICGRDRNQLVLLSTSSFGTSKFNGSSNVYRSSTVKETLDSYTSDNSAYFSPGEIGKMEEVTVATKDDPITAKLYLANAKYTDDTNYDRNNIYVGVGEGSIAVAVSKLGTGDGNLGLSDLFWLRSPNPYNELLALVAAPGDYVDDDRVNGDYVSVVPAFNLNLSSAIFASAAEAASSEYSGDKANSVLAANTYTLRYASSGSESAVISADGTKVTVSGASDKYLVVQNSNGVYVASIGEQNCFYANQITIGGTTLENFNNCKVWLESTDDQRITTAKLAKTEIPTLAAPIFTPAAGTYTANQTVALTSATDGAKIYYTTDGSEPTTASTLYTDAISVSGKSGESVTMTIKVIAAKDGLQTSEVASATYVIEIPAENAGTEDTKTEDTTAATDDTPNTNPANVLEGTINDILTRIANASAGDTVSVPLTAEMDSLPNSIMQALYQKGTVNLTMTYTYDGQTYTVTIPAGGAVNEDTAWYGPLYLAAHYSGTAANDAASSGTAETSASAASAGTVSAATDLKSPKTGDNTPVALLLTLLCFSGLGALALIRRALRRSLNYTRLRKLILPKLIKSTDK